MQWPAEPEDPTSLETTSLETTSLETTSLEAAIHFQRDLYLYWRAVAATDGVPLTSRQLVARPALRRIRERVTAPTPSAPTNPADPTEGEDTRLFFTRRLLERLGLLRLDSEEQRLVAAPQSEMARYLAHPLARRLRIGARLWVAGGWWPDRPDPRGQPPRVMTPAPPRLAVARRRLLESLAALAPGALVTLPALPSAAPSASAARVRPTHPRVRQTVPALPGEEETIRAALRGPLTWMGFVTPDTPSGTSASTDTWRVTHAVAALHEAEPVELPEAPGRVIAQANLEIIAYPPLAAPLLATLDTWAEEVSLATTARYHLSRVALARALRDGWTADRIAATLEALTATALPANVRATLADWERAAERVRFTPAASILEAPAPLLDALLADRAAAGWVERRLAPTAALLTPGATFHVRAWLLRHGELPARIILAADDAPTSSS